VRMRKRQGLHSYVIDELGQAIVSGDFPAGKALPGEIQLCARLDVSRTALREALRVLAAKGLVEARPKVGTAVRCAEAWNRLDTDVLHWSLHSHEADRTIDELYELRHLVEPLAASLAAERAQPLHIRALQEAYNQMCAAGNDGKKIIAPDLEFHQTIIAASGNRLFSSLAHVVGGALLVNFEFVRDAPRGHVRSMRAHKNVLEAIVDRNSSAARVEMQRLIEDSQLDARTLRSAHRGRPSPRSRKTGRMP
jgi:DNA-binding FadR family transcriptional regulator